MLRRIFSLKRPAKVPEKSETALSLNPSINVPLTGIRLSKLKLLVEKLENPEINCYEACEVLVKANTKETKTSFVDWLKNIEPDNVKSKADVFVSYAWGYKFCDLISCIEAGNVKDDEYVWLDMFIINQHESSNLQFEQWAQTFAHALKSIGRALLVIMSWTDPLPITRSWCVFEYTTIVLNQIPFQTQMSTNDSKDFRKLIREGNTDARFYRMLFGTINVENAKAFKDDDRLQILDYLRNVGSLKVNDSVIVPLKNWLVENSQAALEEAGEHYDQAGNVLYVQGALHESLGLLNEAAQFYEKGLEAYKKHHGGDINNEACARSLNDLGLVLQNLGFREKSQQILEQSAEVNKALFGEKSTEYAASVNNLGQIYIDQQNYQRALEVYQQAYEIRKALFGEENELVLIHLENIAVTYEIGFADYTKSRPLKEKALEIKKKLLGEDSVEYAMSLFYVAVLYERLQDFDGAEVKYKQAIDIRRRALGDKHPLLAETYNNYGGLLVQKGDFKNAIIILKNAIEIFKETFGDNAKTANAYEWLAVAYQKAGDQANYKASTKECIRIYTVALGPNDQKTLATIKFFS